MGLENKQPDFNISNVVKLPDALYLAVHGADSAGSDKPEPPLEPKSEIVDLFSLRATKLSNGGEGPPGPPEREHDINIEKAVETYRNILRVRRAKFQAGEVFDENKFGFGPALDRQTATIIKTNQKLEEIYRVTDDASPAAYQLQQGVLAIAGLAKMPEPSQYVDFVIKTHDAAGMGGDHRRRQCMRLFDSLELVEIAYDGLYFTNDEEADMARFKQFVESYCPSKLFEEPKTTELMLDMIRSSYAILRLLAGPEATKHRELLGIVDEVKSGLLTEGVGIKQPTERDINNYRLLAWRNWPNF